MEQQRWQRLDELFCAALELPEEERARFLEEACADDATLLAELKELLACDEDAQDKGFLNNTPELDREILNEDPGPASGPDGLIAHPLSPFEAADSGDRPVGPWGPFELLEVLGEGGAGRVFRARDTRLDRMVAIKVLHRINPQLARRLTREARAQARIDHENVCTVYEVGELDGVPYIAMQLIEGDNLQQAASRMTLEQTVVIMAQVAAAMHAAHQLGIIHRDLKPGNVMLEEAEDGSMIPYVLDFGLAWETDAATLTATGDVLGTPGYMAPEQIRSGGAHCDRRADVFSLGACLYSVLAGRHPFPGDSVTDILLANLLGEPVPLRQAMAEVPADLEAIVMKCLERQPAQRYASARALAEDLTRFLRGEPIAARPSGLWQRALKTARRHRTPLMVAAVVCTVLLAVAGLWLYERWNARTQAALALSFGQEIERIEGMLWKARSLELHDMRPTNDMIRARLLELEQEIGQRGDVAFGPGFTALGRGYLALGDLELARRSLETAWTAGYQTSETAHALGLTLSRQYRKRLRELSLSSPREGHSEAEYQEAVRLLRQPTRDYLARVTTSESTAYVEALLAAAEGEFEQALELARRAVDDRPWLYEAIILEGEVLTELADQQLRSGAYDDALGTFRAAVAAFDRATAIGRSDLRAHRGSCSAAAAALRLRAWRLGETTAQDLQQTVDVCKRSLTIAPDASMIKLHIAGAYGDFAENLLNRGGDPSSALEAARHWEDAVLTEGDGTYMVEAHRSLAHTLWQQGKYEAMQGRDPSDTFTLAIDHGNKALAADDSSSAGYQSLGAVHLEFAIFKGRNQTPHEPDVKKAIEMFEKATELSPQRVEGYANTGAAYFVLAAFATEPSKELDEILAKAKENLEQALALEPGLADACRMLGDVHHALAGLALARGQDPRPALAAAVEALNKAAATKSSDARYYLSISATYQTRAEYELMLGHVPADDLKKARQALTTAQSMLPESLISELLERQNRLEEAARALSNS